jgi:hypothetical protein
MIVSQEFVVIPMEAGVRVYGASDFPLGTPIGPEGQKLHVEGPVWVRPPDPELTRSQWEEWLDQLRNAGWSVSVGPFWTGKPFEELTPEDFVPWDEFRDELLRSAR